MCSREPKRVKTVASWDEVMEPSGDITLIVGREKFRFRCARNILCLSSPAVKKMLDPDTPLKMSDDGTVHLSLPRDEFEPLVLVLRIIHRKTKDVPKKVPFDLLHKLAIVCHKYDMLNSIRQWTTLWCESPMEEAGKPSLFIGFAFRNSEIFQQATKAIILKSEHWGCDSCEGTPEWAFSERYEPSLKTLAKTLPQARSNITVGRFSRS